MTAAGVILYHERRCAGDQARYPASHAAGNEIPMCAVPRQRGDTTQSAVCVQVGSVCFGPCPIRAAGDQRCVADVGDLETEKTKAGGEGRKLWARHGGVRSSSGAWCGMRRSRSFGGRKECRARPDGGQRGRWVYADGGRPHVMRRLGKIPPESGSHGTRLERESISRRVGAVCKVQGLSVWPRRTLVYHRRTIRVCSPVHQP